MHKQEGMLCSRALLERDPRQARSQWSWRQSPGRRHRPRSHSLPQAVCCSPTVSHVKLHAPSILSHRLLKMGKTSKAKAAPKPAVEIAPEVGKRDEGVKKFQRLIPAHAGVCMAPAWARRDTLPMLPPPTAGGEQGRGAQKRGQPLFHAPRLREGAGSV